MLRFSAGRRRPPVETLDERIEVQVRIQHLQHIFVCQPTCRGHLRHSKDAGERHRSQLRMSASPKHLLDSSFGREQGTNDAQADAGRVRVQMCGQTVAYDLGERLQFDCRGLICTETQEDTKPSSRFPLPTDGRRAGVVLILAECRVKPEESSGEDDSVLQRAVRLFTGHLLTLLDDQPRRLRVGDSLDEKPPETLTRRVEAWTVVQPADHGQHLADGDVHEVPSGTVRKRWRLTRPMIPTARG
jgi:hypothetical protein